MDLSLEKYVEIVGRGALLGHEIEALDKAIRSMKLNGIWRKCKLLYVPCLLSEGASRVNIKSPEDFSLQYPEGVTHTPGTGIVADGEVGSYANTDFNLRDNEDDVYNGQSSISFFCSTPSTSRNISPAWHMGHSGGETFLSLRVSLSAGNVRGRGASNWQKTADSQEYWQPYQHCVGGISRTSDQEFHMYAGHTQVRTISEETEENGGPSWHETPDSILQLLGSEGSDSQTNPVSCAFFGGGLTNEESASLGLIIEKLTTDLIRPRPGRCDFFSQNLGVPIDCRVFSPREINPDTSIIVTMHGNGRNVELSIHSATTLAERYNAVVVAPLLDVGRFGSLSYHRMGIFVNDGVLTPGIVSPKETWTSNVIFRVIEDVQYRMGIDVKENYVVGHSAGGQFVHRMALFDPGNITRFVAENSGNYTFLNEDFNYSFGLLDLPEDMKNDEALARYVSTPLSIYIGTADTNYYWDDPYVSGSPGAVAQGDNRYERAHNMFLQGQAVAQRLGVPFNWRIVDAEGIGHSSRGMESRTVLDEAMGIETIN